MNKGRILVLGAGMVAGPLVDYLLDSGFHVKVASRTISKAEKLIGSYPEGEAQELNADNTELMGKLIKEADLAVSLLPPSLHVKPAKIAVKYKKPLVTTSYVSEQMDKLNEEAKEAGVILLNEIGLDPGIDHMSAVKTIDEVHDKGGKITSFRSYCGALPAPEASFNPLRYKFSWHPRGVLHASTSSARYLKNRQQIEIEGENLFENYNFKYIENLGYFEEYPNRDSFPYIDKYKIPETETIYRGTLRIIGWCETLKAMVDLGLLSEEERDFGSLTYRRFMGELIGSSDHNLKKNLTSYLGINDHSRVLKTLEWLGLLSEKTISFNRGSPLDVLADRMKEKLELKEGERDMVILQHEFIIEYPEKMKKVISTFIDYGTPKEDTSIAKTVGLPAAIAAKLILEGEVDLTGVHIPVKKEIYEPVLKELEKEGVKFEERSQAI